MVGGVQWSNAVECCHGWCQMVKCCRIIEWPSSSGMLSNGVEWCQMVEWMDGRMDDDSDDRKLLQSLHKVDSVCTNIVSTLILS